MSFRFCIQLFIKIFHPIREVWVFGLGIFLISMLAFSNIADAEDTNTQFFCNGWIENDGSGIQEPFKINYKWGEPTSSLIFTGRYRFWGAIPYLGNSDLGFSVFLKDKTPVFIFFIKQNKLSSFSIPTWP